MPRPKGSPNKKTSLVERLLEEMKAAPIGHMARLMMDEDADARLRFDAAKELAQYVYPKRRAIEITGGDGEPLMPFVAEVRLVRPNEDP